MYEISPLVDLRGKRGLILGIANLAASCITGTVIQVDCGAHLLA